MKQPARKPGRDDRRRAILDVARAVFFEEGYAEASMSAIAARLGGSKGTLYNYFPSKKDLFDAQIRQQCESHAAMVFEPPIQGGDIRRILTEIGERYLAMLLSETGLQTFRLVTAEAQRDPAIGRVFYEAGPMTTARRLAEFLVRAEADGGLRPLGDPLLAAQQFMALAQATLHKPRLLGLIDAPSSDQISADVASAVRIFMDAFEPRPGAL